MSMSPASTLEILRRLVGFDTVSAHSNLALIDYVRDLLGQQGIDAHLIRDPVQPKANLFATIGPAISGGIALSGHTDVVPVEGQPWDADPFTLTARDGRLVGRGAADMKGFIATALALVPELKALPLRRPLHLCLSYDEEIGCLGAPAMIRAMGANLPKPALAIIGEPTEMRVANAHKGVQAFETVITGKDGHSSAPERGLSAIFLMGRLVGFLEELSRRLAAQGMAQSMPGLEFDPPWTTVSAGRIGGGTAVNIIPRECRMTWEFRPLPGVDSAAILAEVEAFIAQAIRPDLARIAPEGAIETTAIAAVPALAPEREGAAEALALALTGLNATTTVAFASEGGQFQAAGISTVMCGPGSIRQAHQPNEWIAVEQLDHCADFLRQLAATACA